MKTNLIKILLVLGIIYYFISNKVKKLLKFELIMIPKPFIFDKLYFLFLNGFWEFFTVFSEG
jgi:hypothetical protein